MLFIFLFTFMSFSPYICKAFQDSNRLTLESFIHVLRCFLLSFFLSPRSRLCFEIARKSFRNSVSLTFLPYVSRFPQNRNSGRKRSPTRKRTRFFFTERSTDVALSRRCKHWETIVIFMKKYFGFCWKLSTLLFIFCDALV